MRVEVNPVSANTTFLDKHFDSQHAKRLSHDTNELPTNLNMYVGCKNVCNIVLHGLKKRVKSNTS